MQIDDPEALRTWLAVFLEPLCDADPVALSKYVLALVKKDKDESELRQSMTEQMNVFLQKYTESFIDHLFKALESKEYLEGPPTHPLVPEVMTAEEEEEAKKKKVKEEPRDAGDVEKQPPDSTTPVRDSGSAEASHDTKQTEVKKEGERYRRGEGYERARRRSRSRSPRRFSRRSPNGRRFRQGSPRARSRSRSPAFRRSSRRSPYRMRSRSRSFSPSYKRRDSRGSTPIRDEDSGANPYTSAPPTVPPPVSTSGPSPHKRPRCRDYDEKGFCMRGDQCKFDHGNDAVVLEDAAGVPPYQPVGIPSAYTEPYVPAGSSVPLPPLNVPPPGYQPTPSTAYPLANAPPAAIPRKRSYDPSLEDTAYPPNKMSAFSRLGPAAATRGGFRGRGGRGSKQLAVRNIPPQVNNIAHLNNHFAKFGNLVNVQIQFEGDPASALVTFSNKEEAEGAFTSAEAILGNRFIKMYYHYERPTPVPMRGGFQGGRSVKERLSLGAPISDGPEKVKYEGEILTKTISNQPEKTEEEKQAEAQQKSEEKAAAIAAIKQNQDMLEAKAQMKKEAEEKRAEQVKKVQELQKSKQGLLEKLIEEQKKLILKIEESKKPEEKAEIMKLVKSLSASIDKAREDIKRAVSSVQQQQRKSPTELQKELLDAELELHQAEQDNSEARQEIQKKVNRLRLEAARLGVLATSKPPRGSPMGGRGFFPRGGYVRGGRGGFYAPRGTRGGRYIRRGGRFLYQGATIDRRTTKILVSGYEVEEKEELLAHFQKFGEMLDPVDHDETPSLIVQFRSRQEAELAMTGGKAFKDRTIELAWYTPPPGSVDTSEVANASAGCSPGSSLLLSPTGGAGGGGADSNNASALEEDDDDYTPLDPAYLPPGLDDEAEEEDKENLETSNDDVDLLYDENDQIAEEAGVEGEAKKEEEEEEGEDDEGERSWKR